MSISINNTVIIPYEKTIYCTIFSHTLLIIWSLYRQTLHLHSHNREGRCFTKWNSQFNCVQKKLCAYNLEFGSRIFAGRIDMPDLTRRWLATCKRGSLLNFFVVGNE